LGVDEADARKLHLAACGAAYENSVLEAMAAGGVVSEQYREALGKVADRLYLSAENTQAIMRKVASAKLEPMVAQLVSQFEATVLTKEQLAQKRGQDLGEDIGVEAGNTLGVENRVNMFTEAANILEFLQGNQLLPSDEDDYPVTALGMADVRIFEEIYRQVYFFSPLLPYFWFSINPGLINEYPSPPSILIFSPLH